MAALRLGKCPELRNQGQIESQPVYKEAFSTDQRSLSLGPKTNKPPPKEHIPPGVTLELRPQLSKALKHMLCEQESRLHLGSPVIA